VPAQYLLRHGIMTSVSSSFRYQCGANDGMFARFGFAVFLTLAYVLSIMNWQDYISITPGVRSGKPCVRGTRITVSDVLEYLAGGMDEQAILADFPELRREHIQAVLGFAAERERRLSALPAVS
jgi:uncharacterized protein (DUF433 family)